MSYGMDRATGRWLTGNAHIRQSIADILTTRVKSRVLARDYGSDVPSRVDAPMNEVNKLALFADIHAALQPRRGLYGTLGEPRFAIKQIRIADATVQGRIALVLLGVEYPNGHKGDFTPANGGGLATYTFGLTQ